MAGTIVADIIQSDQSYASSINIASPMVVSNTLTMGAAAAVSGNVNFDSGTLFVDSVNNTVGIGTQNPISQYALDVRGNMRLGANTNAEQDIEYVCSTGSWQVGTNAAGGGTNQTNVFYIYDNASATYRMTVDQAGRFRHPYQPCFTASTSSATTGPGILPFNSTQINVGSHFNTSTYRFTAPIAGKYFFHYHNNHDVGSAGSPSALYVDFYKNGSTIGVHRMYTYYTGGWEELSGCTILDLNANDYVQVYLATSHRADAGTYSCFLGYLLH